MDTSWIFLKDNINIPNLLSLLRIVLIIPFAFYVMADDYIKAGLILGASGITDLCDGFIARKYNQITKLGTMLDPVADKLTLITVMICVGIKFSEILPFVIVMIVKEISMIFAGGFLIKNNKSPLSAKWYGKLSTFSFYFSVITVIFIKALFHVDFKFLTISLMSVTSCLMIFSLVKYIQLFLDILKK